MNFGALPPADLATRALFSKMSGLVWRRKSHERRWSLRRWRLLEPLRGAGDDLATTLLLAVAEVGQYRADIAGKLLGVGFASAADFRRGSGRVSS